MLTVCITEGHARKLGLKSPEILKVYDVGYITEICRSGAYLYFIVGEIIDCDPMLFRLCREPEPWESLPKDEIVSMPMLERNEEIVGGTYFCWVTSISPQESYKSFISELSDECQGNIKDIPLMIDPVLESREIDSVLEKQLETVSVHPIATVTNG
jgi:hypothetical protein